tara:strand:- start:1004 stop:2317 length:1314 start_codon:yes stop_codon:yes gene_type:complete
MEDRYTKNSLTLFSVVAMGTGVMIGAGIFALTGQVAELSGPLFPFAFIVAAVISGFSAYTYIKMSNAYPSAGGIGMYLQKAYGKTMMTGGCALLMAISMVINESLVARTFGTYTMQLFSSEENSVLVPVLGVALIILAFLINIAGNKIVGLVSQFTTVLKIGGILLFAIAALWASGINYAPTIKLSGETSVTGFLAATALAILAYKGFTTITNSGSEIINPHKNVGRAIIISLVICLIIYLLVAVAVGSSLSIEEIIRTKNYSLAEAARPAFGQYGAGFTIVIAMIATASGLIASIFSVSRMLAMLTDMKIIPHSHFGMPGTIQHHTLVYTVVLAALLTIFFDLSRIASLGAIFYIVMDIAVHWGVFRYIRKEIDASPSILLAAMFFDIVVLGSFVWMKANSDPMIIGFAVIGIVLIFLFEKVYLQQLRPKDHSMHM